MQRRGWRLVVLSLVLLGCTRDSADSAAKTVLAFEGRGLRLAVPDDYPFVDSLRLQAADWESRNGARVEIVPSREDAGADVVVLAGDDARAFSKLPFLPLGDVAADQREFPRLYRSVLGRRNDRPVALALAGDLLFLWYRGDLFSEESTGKAFKERYGRELAPPRTWDEYLQAAEFFQGRSPVSFGCAEAFDGSPAAVRSFLAHSAAYGKGPDRSSFLIDAETGRPLLDGPAFERGLVEWLVARKSSPAATGDKFDAAAAARNFLDGKSAMLIARLEPLVLALAEGPSGVVKEIRVQALPGSTVRFSPRTGTPETLESPERCDHLATTGWFVGLGATSDAASLSLLRFLAASEEPSHLAPAARRGYLPVASHLLAQPNRFSAYGLPPEAVSGLFRTAAAAFQGNNWVADLRIDAARALEESLGEQLSRALDGTVEPQKALSSAQTRWKAILESSGPAFLEQLRDSLGLPALLTPPASNPPSGAP